MGRLVPSPLPSGGSLTLQSAGQKQKWPTCGRIGYITCDVYGVPDALERGEKSDVAHMCANLKQHVDKCDPTMSPKPHWWQRSFYLTNSDCSSGVHWFVLGAVVEPAMHV